MNLTVTLPLPHPKQADIRTHPAKRKVICAGRRFGKTHMAASEGVERGLQGRRVLFASPTQDQVDTFWTLAKAWLQPVLDRKLLYKNESRRIIEFPGGGRIKAKTAWNADTMRGDYGDFIVLDEYAQMTPDVWDYVVSPMLLDTDGDCWFISTPVRRNHFFTLYQKAVQDDTGRWKEFYATTHDNPFLSQDALADLTADMSEEAYQQEIMAMFLEGAGAVFRNLDACMNADWDLDPRTMLYDVKVAGVDWGKQQDYSVISVFDVTTGHEVDLDRFNKIDYTVQRDRVLSLCAHWGVKYLWVEHNSIGIPNFEMLQRDAPEGLEVVAFETTPSSKPPLIENLALAFERSEAQWLPAGWATGELESYERKVSLMTGRSSYSAPEGLHDDSVIARALAWWAASHMPSAYLQQLESRGLYTSRTDQRGKVPTLAGGNGLYASRRAVYKKGPDR